MGPPFWISPRAPKKSATALQGRKQEASRAGDERKRAVIAAV